MTWYYILLIIFGALGILYFIFCGILVHILTYPKDRRTREGHTLFNKEKGLDKGTEVLERKPIDFIMDDGYVIHGDYSENKNSNKIAIMCHGYTSTREGMIAHGLLFYELGYSVLLYDERSHGDNLRKDTKLGKIEAKDLNNIIKQMHKTYGKDKEIGLLGVSMGSATVMLVSQYKPNIKFIVADCGYAYLKDVLVDKLKKWNIPGKPFLFGTNIIASLFHGFSFKESSPIYYIGKNSYPILFIHGTADTFVFPYHLDYLWKETKSYKERVYFEGKIHAMAIEDRDLYKKSLNNFLLNIEKEKY